MVRTTTGSEPEGHPHTGESTFSGTANGGGAEGTFNGQFYGDVVEDVPNTEGNTDNESVFPSDAAGEFNATFSNGTVAGAFGANEDD